MMLKLLYCIFPILIWQTCIHKSVSNTNEITSQELIKDSISFGSHVQLILEKKCSPCHFPGGKMYQKMPFDQDTTILNHETGILKRFKDDDKRIIGNFIHQKKNGLPTDKPLH